MPIRFDPDRAKLIEVELSDNADEARAKDAVRLYLSDPSAANEAAALSLIAELNENRITTLKQITGS